MTGGRKVDVAIIGAGAAGLSAATRLKEARRRVLVLEARDRVGGRIETLRDAAFELPIELGAEFVHGKPKVLVRALRKQGIRPRRHADSHWALHDGRLLSVDDTFEDVSKLLMESGRADRTFAAHLADPRTKARWSQLQRAMAAMFVEGYYAAPLNVAGTAAISHMEKAGAEVKAQTLFRVTEGYDVLPRALAEDLARPDELWLNAVVREVRWGPSGVTITARTRGGAQLPTVEAHSAIITVPLAVLAAREGAEGSVRFAPGLPQKAAAVRQLATGAIVKVALRFRRAFWDDRSVRERAASKLRRFSFAHGPGLPVPTFWMPRPFEAPVLVGWAAGPLGEALSGAREDRVLLAALQSMSALFGHPVQALETLVEAVRVRDWQKDPYARGGYAVLPPAGLAAQATLAKPVTNRLFFAGEATHEGGFAGTVNGAMQTGVRAANEALAAARR